MNDLYINGKITLENKEPYNGRIIKNGKLVDNGNDKSLIQFQNLNILTGIGIGIGDAAIKELASMGFTTIDELKIIYEMNKFKNFRKGLRNPLCKYFEGNVVEKMTREEATKWKKLIDSIIDSTIDEIYTDTDIDNDIDIKYSIAGSYARKKENIGDIDYVIVIDNNDFLYICLNKLLDNLADITKIGNKNVKLDSVTETPSKSLSKQRYSTGIKMWFETSSTKTKIEIYGYSMSTDDFCFAYFARSADVNLQKKIKFHASKKGYKLSPYGLFDKESDINIYEIPEQRQLIQKKLGKKKITTIRDLYKFLDYPIKNHS